MGASSTPLDVQCFLVPKTGSSSDECEDAIDVLSPPDASSLFAAVSDGASESLLAGAWARQLAHGAVMSMAAADEEPGGREDDLSRAFVEDLLARTVDQWDGYISDYQAERAARGRPIAWYEQPGLDKGAFATLVAVHMRAAPAVPETSGAARCWVWRAFALGDSCLFHLRDDRLVTSFPITDSHDFGITPQLLGSRNRDAGLIADRVSTATGELYAGDELLLATDALAAWLLSHPEIDSGGAGKQLGNLADLDRELFAEWVQSERDKSRMRNDDVALIRMRVKTEG
ncbi:hypothetical protein [Streptomyces sp. WAC08241]|uniref:hypothetical protein n=1 Tax=Streptomyces sp. WAC08241 TaxID=2487421 RepID=UPI000F7B6665|nr:hypothetical protein [Streptomyces sp. WAC08241]RSS45669.1 hypothetical protein EF906_04120 [Streptomyces sp. WAC08241]